jgi:hypothetical protein
MRRIGTLNAFVLDVYPELSCERGAVSDLSRDQYPLVCWHTGQVCRATSQWAIVNRRETHKSYITPVLQYSDVNIPDLVKILANLVDIWKEL